MSNKIIYKNLSYTINGALFSVFKNIGGKHYEKILQKAIAHELDEKKIRYSRELRMPIVYNGEHLSTYIVDFLIEEKIILEIKRGSKFLKNNFEQIEAYLKAHNLKLGLLALFTNSGVKIARVLNLY